MAIKEEAPEHQRQAFSHVTSAGGLQRGHDSGAANKMLEPTINERHYKVEEVSARWNMSQDTVRRLFLNEPGVIRYSRPRTKYKRGYTTLLIPESVLNRVYRRMTVAA